MEGAISHIILNLDKPRKFRMDMTAIYDFQHETGFKMSQLPTLGPKIDGDSSILLKLIWCGVRHEDESLTWREIGRFIPPKEYADIMTRVITHIIESLGLKRLAKKGERATPKKTVPKKSGTGKKPSKPQQK
jgi:hypothetical protein